MAMSNYLRKTVIDRLNDIKTQYGINEISYRVANDENMFPHIVVDFPSITPTDMGREDFLMDIHIWTQDNYAAFEIMDAVRNLFEFWNEPDDNILPTFYELSGGQIDDPDKKICHLVLRAQGQVYETNATDSGILTPYYPETDTATTDSGANDAGEE